MEQAKNFSNGMMAAFTTLGKLSKKPFQLVSSLHKNRTYNSKLEKAGFNKTARKIMTKTFHKKVSIENLISLI
jgi:hypothetical protein